MSSPQVWTQQNNNLWSKKKCSYPRWVPFVSCMHFAHLQNYIAGVLVYASYSIYIWNWGSFWKAPFGPHLPAVREFATAFLSLAWSLLACNLTCPPLASSQICWIYFTNASGKGACRRSLGKGGLFKNILGRWRDDPVQSPLLSLYLCQASWV